MNFNWLDTFAEAVGLTIGFALIWAVLGDWIRFLQYALTLRLSGLETILGKYIAGRMLAPRRSHKPTDGGSIPPPATIHEDAVHRLHP